MHTAAGICYTTDNIAAVHGEPGVAFQVHTAAARSKVWRTVLITRRARAAGDDAALDNLFAVLLILKRIHTYAIVHIEKPKTLCYNVPNYKIQKGTPKNDYCTCRNT